MQPRVLINCKWKCHGRLTGVQRYANELVRAMDESGFQSDQAQPSEGSSPWRSTYWEHRILPKIAKKYDTIVCPANMAPAQLPTGVGLILVVHCLRFYYHPENYSRGFGAWYRFMIPRLIHRADRVVTVSQTAADQIVDVYPHAKGKVEVVSPGASNAFHLRHDQTQTDDLIGEAPYWVYVGNTAPAKNLRVILNALSELDSSHRVVLLGVSQDQYRRMCNGELDTRVIPLGHINDTTRVASILRDARGLLSPSVYESFDLPIIEAMSCGCPVIASDIQVHLEIGGDAPLYVSSNDPSEWRSAMEDLSQNSEQHALMRDRGFKNAQRFSWGHAATQMIKIINDVHMQRTGHTA